MIKKNISSFELAVLAEELQVMINGKISQIYHPEKKEVVFQVYIRGEGKRFLRIIPGKFLNFTSEKKSVLRPSGFCMQLRKYLNNSIIREVYQKDSERILIIVLETAISDSENKKKLVKYNLIIEFFSKGNLLITDSDWDIIGTLSSQRWEARIIKNKEKYLFPPGGFDWKKLKPKIVETAIKRSDKKNLATCLATELSLGGVFAEEICKSKNIDPKKSLAETNIKEIKDICVAIKEFVSLIGSNKTAGYIFENGTMFPLPFIGEEINKKYETYSGCLDLVDPFETVTPYQQKINSVQKIISGQEEAIKSIEKSIKKDTSIGDKIYDHYSEIQNLLNVVKSLKKEQSWEEIKKLLMKEKRINKVDLKLKKVILNL